jgi:hypothetical protein
MNRNILYGMLFALLALAVWFLVIQRDSASRSLRSNQFSYPDTAGISKIFLADLGDRSVLLERQSDGRWLVNGRFAARPDAINTLLTTVIQIEAKHPVARTQRDFAIREIAGNHVKVEIYNRKGKRDLTYFVGPPTQRNRGNFMKLEKSKEPFVVHIPGFDGFLQTRYPLDEADWKDRGIFRYQPDAIKRLEVTYTVNPDSSWVLEQTAAMSYSLTSRLEGDRPVNNRAALVYLSHYRQIGAESLLNDWHKRDSVLASTPICTLAVNPGLPDGQTVLLYYRPVNKRTKTQFDPLGNPLDFERDKYFAAYNDKRDFALVQDFVFGKLFVGPSYFLQPEPPR